MHTWDLSHVPTGSQVQQLLRLEGDANNTARSEEAEPSYADETPASMLEDEASATSLPTTAAACVRFATSPDVQEYGEQ